MHTNQVVVWFDAKQLSEVAKGQRCIRFQTEIREVMCWSQVAALTGEHVEVIKVISVKKTKQTKFRHVTQLKAQV